MNKQKLKLIIGCGSFLIACSLSGCEAKTVQRSSSAPVENTLVGNAPLHNQPVENLIGTQETGSIDLEGFFTVNGTAKTCEQENLESTTENQNTILIKNEGSLILNHSSLHKTGDTTDREESNSYALNSVFAAVGGSSAKISDTSLTSSSNGSNAVFASGYDSNITISDSFISTDGNDSGGLYASYGGSIAASNVTIKTKGENSPCMNANASITGEQITGIAENSQCAVVEGSHILTLSDSVLTGGGENGIMLYQSAPRDASTGTGVFQAADSSLTTTAEGPLFYITNTNALITLSNTSLNFPSGILLHAAGDGSNWGTEGSNSGNVILKTANQILSGDITCDNISLVSLVLTDHSVFTGAIDTENTGDVTICPDSSSIWNVTGDSYITAITNDDNSLSFLHSNGYTIYYEASNSLNEWLQGRTISLSGGGILTPGVLQPTTE